MQGLFCIKSVHAFVYIMGGVGPGVVYMNTSTKSVLTGALFSLHHFIFDNIVKTQFVIYMNVR